MRGLIKGAKIAGFTAAMALMMTATASAGALYEPSMKDDPAPARRCALSANVALTTDYVFRGFSQTDESAAIQGGFDVACGMFYAGVWASNLDFGGDQKPPFGPAGEFVDVANIEIDYYAGVKVAVPRTPIELDLGVIYYTYPNAYDKGPNAPFFAFNDELDYWEFKVGASAQIRDNLSVGATIFYSPEYTGQIGENWVFEGKTELTLPKIAIFSPAVSATVGYQEGDEADGGFDYWYYNAGISLGFHEKFSLDIRYWDTADLNGCSTATLFQCDERIVGTLTASF